MPSEKTLLVDYFPKDGRLYLVGAYHGIRISTGYSRSPKIRISVIPTDGWCNALGEGEMCDVSLSDLAALRLGTIWKDGRYVADALCSVRSKGLEFVARERIGFDFSRDGAKISRHGRDGTKTFTELTGRLHGEKIRVFIPSPELLVSTYVPHTLTELPDIVTNPIEDVCRERLERSETEMTDGNGNCVIKAHFRKTFHEQTMMFFAYACAHDASRKAVGHLYSSLQAGMGRSPGGATTLPLEVFPWHPGRCKMEVSGFRDREKGLFWVQRILRLSWPRECELFLKHPGDGAPGEAGDGEEKREGPGISRRPVDDDVPVTGDVDPGGEAGMKYVKTGVGTLGSWKDRVHITRRECGRHASAREKKPEREAVAASSGELSGQKASENVAAVVYRPSGDTDEEKAAEDPFHGIPAALELLSKCRPGLRVRYLDDGARRSRERTYCTLKPGRAFDRKRKSGWATMGKRGRRLLVAEVSAGGKVAYVVDIERREGEKYRWLLLLPPDPLDAGSLGELRDLVVWNRGRYYTGDAAQKGRGKDGKSPEGPRVLADPHRVFHHSRKPESMAERILAGMGLPCDADFSGCDGE